MIPVNRGGSLSTRVLRFPSGVLANGRNMAFIGDANGNSVFELTATFVSNATGGIFTQSRNATGAPQPFNINFTP